MATPTYTPIQTYTVSGTSTSSVTFGAGNTLPQTYTDLILICSGTVTAGADIGLRFNSDSGANYSFTQIKGNGTAASSSRSSSQTFAWVDWAGFTTSQGQSITHIQNYANNTTYKTTLSRFGQAGNATDSVVTLWRGSTGSATQAITQIDAIVNGANFGNGFTLTLYGIANAAIGAPKATGGIITYDNTYYYHTFGLSGTFTPQQSLTADVLLVAGGGGGGSGLGGAGGAGGVRALASQSLTATGYAVTVGSGGSGGAGGSSYTNGSPGGSSSLIGGALSISASGGGYGGTGGANAGGSGGSGGGGGGSGGATGAGGSGNSGSYSPVEGYAGGAGNQTNSPNITGGGGGGAGAIGETPNVSGGTGVGGIGVTSTFINAIGTTAGVGYPYSGNYYFGAGGGGGNFNPPIVLGGIGGGGAGGNDQNGTQNASNAVALTGSGGGGGGYTGVSSGKGNGGNGGSGVVIIRYLKA